MRRPGYVGACWPEPLAEALLRAAVLPPDGAAAAWSEIRPVVELDDLWDDELHRLLPLIHANLRSAGVEDADLARMKGLHRRTWYDNQLTLRRARPGYEALRATGIATLFLKGAPLALEHYGDLGLRPMADVDVLIPWDDVPRALDLLEHAGWYEVHHRSRSDLLRRHHGSQLAHPDGGQLDVHWHLGAPLLLPEDERASNDDFWAASVPFVAPAHGIDAVTLCSTDMLLHVIAHGLWAASAATVRWVADARVVIGTGSDIDWERLADQSLRRRIAPLLGDALRYLAEEFQAPVPSEVIEELRAAATTPRERRLLRALAGPTEGSARWGWLRHARSYWAYTRLKWSPLRSMRELPPFLADLAGVERPRDLILIARQLLRRLARRAGTPIRPGGQVRPPAVSVVVPTHHRPEHLSRCLDALEAQTTPPHEVVVIRGPDDIAAAEVLAARDMVTEVVVATPRVVERLHAGARQAGAPVVAFTDDDAAPRPDWIAGIQHHFTDGTIGAVGGRDVQPGDVPATLTRVGTIGLGGRLVGGHSHGTGPARDVDHLRGVNMAFRRHLLRLPVGLRGPGAPDYNELAACLAVREQGRRVLYDPALLVDHSLAPRYEHGDGHRVHPALAKRVDDAFNQTYVLLAMRPRRRVSRMAYVLLIGDRSTGGLLRCTWARLSGDVRLARQLRPLLRAQLDAWRESRHNPLRLVSPEEPFPEGDPAPASVGAVALDDRSQGPEQNLHVESQ